MKQRLLIVDDEPGIVDMMASYFSSQYEVLTAYCGNEALQKLARQPDLILLREFDGCIIKKLLTGRIKRVFFCQVFCFII